jgi:hypothetical protein
LYIVRPNFAELHQTAFEAFGVPIAVGVANPELLPRVCEVFPPGWRRVEAEQATQRFALTAHDGGVYRIWWDGGSVAGSADLNVALHVLDNKISAHIALNAPELIFVHAGVVVHDGGAIVIPGASFSGKTTLVAELVCRGATYYSDEYAVIDADGLVHPYARRIAFRGMGAAAALDRVESQAGAAGDKAAGVSTVVVTQYEPGAGWQPQQISPGVGALALMANTAPAQERPEQSLHAIRRAVEDALVLEGPRGEAASVARQLLEGALV